MRPLLAVILTATGACAPGTDLYQPGEPGPTPRPYGPVVPEFSWVEDASLDMRAVLPEDLQGLVWAFHGGGGGLHSVRQTEWIAEYNAFVQRGLGVVLTQSRDRRTGRWFEADVDHLDQIYQALIEDHDVPSDIGMGALSFSNGGFAVQYVLDDASLDWTFAAASVHQGSAEITSIPTLYIAAENDEVGRDDSFYYDSGVVSACRALAGDCRLRLGREVPLNPGRFTRVPRVDSGRSEAYFEDLERLGLVDSEGQRLVDVTTRGDTNRHIDRFRQRTQDRGSIERVATQVRVVWATHRLSAQFADEEADFLLEHLTR